MLNQLQQLTEQLDIKEDHLFYCKSLFTIIERLTIKIGDTGTASLIEIAKRDLIKLIDEVVKLKVEISQVKDESTGGSKDELESARMRLDLLEIEYDKTNDLSFLPLINELRDEVDRLTNKQHQEFIAFKEKVEMSHDEIQNKQQWSVKEAIEILATQMAEQNAAILKALSEQNQTIMQAMTEQTEAILRAIEALEVEVEEITDPVVLEEIELLESLLESEKPSDNVPSTISSVEEAMERCEQWVQTTAETIMVERDRLMADFTDSTTDEIEIPIEEENGFTLLPDEDEEEAGVQSNEEFPTHTVNLREHCDQRFAEMIEKASRRISEKIEEVDTAPTELTNEPYVQHTDPVAEDAWWSVSKEETIEVEAVEVNEAETYEPMILEDAIQYTATLHETSLTPKTVVITTPTYSKDNYFDRIYTTSADLTKSAVQQINDRAKADIDSAYRELVNPDGVQLLKSNVTAKIEEIWEDTLKSQPSTFNPISQQQMFDPPGEVDPNPTSTINPVMHTDEDMQQEQPITHTPIVDQDPITREVLMMSRFNTNLNNFKPYTDSHGKQYNLYFTKVDDEVTGSLNDSSAYYAKQVELLKETGLRWFLPGKEELKAFEFMMTHYPDKIDIPKDKFFLSSHQCGQPVDGLTHTAYKLVHDYKYPMYTKHIINVQRISKDEVFPVRLIAREYI